MFADGRYACWSTACERWHTRGSLRGRRNAQRNVPVPIGNAAGQLRADDATSKVDAAFHMAAEGKGAGLPAGLAPSFVPGRSTDALE